MNLSTNKLLISDREWRITMAATGVCNTILQLSFAFEAEISLRGYGDLASGWKRVEAQSLFMLCKKFFKKHPNMSEAQQADYIRKSLIEHIDQILPELQLGFSEPADISTL